MGLDVYVGSLTRYHLGDWLTIVQQAARDTGTEVQVIRAAPEPDERLTDPAEVRAAILRWRANLATSTGRAADWPEDAALPYWTDKPDWDGYGGVVLLAAYDEQPAAPRSTRSGLFRRTERADDPRRFEEAAAYRAARTTSARYPSLLGSVEWWLPTSGGPPVHDAPRPSGHPVAMSHVDQLVWELRTLNERTLQLSGPDLDRARQQGPPERGAPVEDVGRFGLAVLLHLAEKAAEHRQPLLLDY